METPIDGDGESTRPLALGESYTLGPVQPAQTTATVLPARRGSMPRLGRWGAVALGATALGLAADQLGFPNPLIADAQAGGGYQLYDPSGVPQEDPKPTRSCEVVDSGPILSRVERLTASPGGGPYYGGSELTWASQTEPVDTVDKHGVRVAVQAVHFNPPSNDYTGWITDWKYGETHSVIPETAETFTLPDGRVIVASPTSSFLGLDFPIHIHDYSSLRDGYNILSLNETIYGDGQINDLKWTSDGRVAMTLGVKREVHNWYRVKGNRKLRRSQTADKQEFDLCAGKVILGDYGSSYWRQITLMDQNQTPFEITGVALCDCGSTLVSTQNALLRSVDGGMNWERVPLVLPGFEEATSPVWSMRIYQDTQATSSVIRLSIALENGEEWIYRSDDFLGEFWVLEKKFTEQYDPDQISEADRIKQGEVNMDGVAMWDAVASPDDPNAWSMQVSRLEEGVRDPEGAQASSVFIEAGIELGLDRVYPDGTGENAVWAYAVGDGEDDPEYLFVGRKTAGGEVEVRRVVVEGYVPEEARILGDTVVIAAHPADLTDRRKRMIAVFLEDVWRGEAPEAVAAGGSEPAEALGASVVASVDDDNFKVEVSGVEGPVLVDYWAGWCAPCVQMAPSIEQFAVEYAGKLKVAKMDVNPTSWPPSDPHYRKKDPATPSQEWIRGYPTLIIYYKGHEVDRYEDWVNEEHLKAWIDATLADIATPVVDPDIDDF